MANRQWQFDPWTLRRQLNPSHHHPSDDTRFGQLVASHNLEVVQQSGLSHGHSVHNNHSTSPGSDLFYGLDHHDQLEPEGSDSDLLTVNAQVRYHGFNPYHDDGVLGQSFPWGGPGHNAVTPAQVHLVDSGIHGQGDSIPLVQSPPGHIATASYGDGGYPILQPDDSNSTTVTGKHLRGNRKHKNFIRQDRHIDSRYSGQVSTATSDMPLVQPLTIIGWAQDASMRWQDIKKNARVAMKKALFDEGPFPSTDQLNRMVDKAIENTLITVYSGDTIVQWKLRPEGVSLAKVLKRVAGEVRTDFNRAAQIAKFLAFDLSLGCTEGSKEDMWALRVTKVNLLLLDKSFIHSVTSAPATGYPLWTPFGSSVVLNLLEYLTQEKDYLTSLSLDEDGWEVRLQNATAFIAAYLEIHLQGLAQGSASQQSTVAMSKFEENISQMLGFQEATEVRFRTRLEVIRRALQ